ncbi:MAG: oligogalacturonate lyase [Candidatus Poribacteria bacterium]|nr:MAG: oligogalacturonate lyase [Candidatus Poribacteria bacterium]
MTSPQRLPGEAIPFQDAETGVTGLQLTRAEAIHHTLYFTHSSVTADGRWVVFVSNRLGGWNLFAAATDGGEIRVLTRSGEVNPFSGVIHPFRSCVYFSARETVRSVDIETGEERTLLQVPGARWGGCHLDAAGERLLTVLRRGETGRLVWLTTDGSHWEEFFAPPRPVYYAQFCPANPEWVLYSSGIDQRMWIVHLRGWRDRPLYLHNREVWITHESWLGSSETVLFTRWPDALMAIERNGSRPRVIAAVNAWHASSRRDGGLIVADTVHPDRGLILIDPETGRWRTWCYPKASCQGTRWKFRTPEPGPVREETYGPQWTHPHPAFSLDGRWITFTSDASGYPQVYLIPAPERFPEEDNGQHG